MKAEAAEQSHRTKVSPVPSYREEERQLREAGLIDSNGRRLKWRPKSGGQPGDLRVSGGERANISLAPESERAARSTFAWRGTPPLPPDRDLHLLQKRGIRPFTSPDTNSRNQINSYQSIANTFV